MGCRANDIIKYRHDIQILESASELAQSVINRQTIIGNDLTNLQSGYGDTVKASDELINEFHKLDDGADSSASGIKSRIDEALTEANNLLKSAEEEEDDCPIHHPKVPVNKPSSGPNMSMIM